MQGSRKRPSSVQTWIKYPGDSGGTLPRVGLLAIIEWAADVSQTPDVPQPDAGCGR